MKDKLGIRLKTKLFRLNPDKSREEAIRDFVRSRRRTSFAVFLAGMLLASVVGIQQLYERNDIVSIKRGEYGEDSKIVNRSFTLEGMKKENLDIEVFAREYKEEEIDAVFHAIKEKLPEMIRAENPNLNEVRKPLLLIKGFDHLPATVYWQSDNDSVLRSDGEVFNKEIGDEGKRVVLDYSVQLGERVFKDSIEIRVLPPVYTEEEAAVQAVLHRVKEEERSGRSEAYYSLPTEVNGRSVKWTLNSVNSFLPLMLLSAVLSLLIYYLQEKKLDERLKERRRQLIFDYYEITNKLILYIEAGISPRTAFEKLAREYSERPFDGREQKRYAYEEILILCREMQSGISEPVAYENCGKRCELIPYRKLFGYLSQSLKKGSVYLVTKLKYELQDAFELRKATAVRLGEEARTKLMFPMLMMLGIVIALMMIPAFYAFGL